MKYSFFLAAAVLFVLNGHASTVDTVSVPSASMNKMIKTVVITPDGYAGQDSLPTVYLLHGYSGDYGNWVNQVPEIKELADRYKIIIVCPDGGYGSWYWDSPEERSFRYETFVSNELVSWVDSRYKTIKNRNGRAIAGLSMGGQGALYLAMKHLDVYGAAGSTAGGVDIRPFPLNWDMAKRLGSYAEFPERWEAHAVINMVHLLTPNALALIIDCGTGDFFFGVNEKLHMKLLERNIPHTYITGPGGHNWAYWQESIAYQLLYFSKFFSKQSS